MDEEVVKRIVIVVEEMQIMNQKNQVRKNDDEEEAQVIDRARQDQPDLPAEYWQIQRLVKYLKGGNPTASCHRLIIDSRFQFIRRNMSISLFAMLVVWKFW